MPLYYTIEKKEDSQSAEWEPLTDHKIDPEEASYLSKIHNIQYMSSKCQQISLYPGCRESFIHCTPCFEINLKYLISVCKSRVGENFEACHSLISAASYSGVRGPGPT